MTRRLRIAHVAPPLEPVPPPAYGGTERIVAELVAEQTRRGHDVTTFASGDSHVPGRLVETVPRALRPIGFIGDWSPLFVATVLKALDMADQFDVIHSHVEWYSPLLASASPTPVVTTFHGRLDFPWAHEVLMRAGGNYVAISRAQAATHPDVPWTAIVYNGLTLRDAPFVEKRGDDLCFVGRVAPEKGILDAIEIARRTGRTLRMAAKVGTAPHEREYNEDVFKPALAAAGSIVEYLGELQRPERDRLMSESYAMLMPGSWPEPFGLVAIESLACGTPVLARRVGALPEIVREGIDGLFGDDLDRLAFLVDRLGALDRRAIRDSVIERFSAERMADRYEEVYGDLVEGRAARGREARASVGVMDSVVVGLTSVIGVEGGSGDWPLTGGPASTDLPPQPIEEPTAPHELEATNGSGTAR